MIEESLLSEEQERRQNCWRQKQREYKLKSDAAKKCLEERLSQEPHAYKKYCENTTVNAAIMHYVTMAERNDIKVTVSANRDLSLSVCKALKDLDLMKITPEEAAGKVQEAADHDIQTKIGKIFVTRGILCLSLR